jgi:GNAT superfamily N-acetyltransferase
VIENSIVVRSFQPSDIAGVTGLTNELGYDTAVEQMAKRMETIGQQDHYWTLVAVAGTTVAGYIGLTKNYFWEYDGHYIRIQALVVKKEYRRLGIGKKLIDAAENLARDTNARLMVLNCGNRAERGAAHQFYPKMGFEPKSTGYVKKLE